MANKCSECQTKIDTNENFECPTCGYKFWQSKEVFEKSHGSQPLADKGNTKHIDTKVTLSEEKMAPTSIPPKLSCCSFPAIIGLIIFIGFIWYFWGGGLDKQASNQMDTISKQVVLDSAEQYNIAKRNGDKVDICVQAGMVAAASLQAKEETLYQQWKQIEKADCAAAGVPQ